jgi:hypothetical protein
MTAALRLTLVVAGIVVLAILAAANSQTQPPPRPYWIGDFRSGGYCQYATIFQSSTVTPGLGLDGYVFACPQQFRPRPRR